jgi:hypothetical protein
MFMDDDVIVRPEERGLISVLTMEYRPYNLLGPTLIGAIAAEITGAQEVGSRAIVLRSGLRHFSAGADVNLFASRIERGGRREAAISGVDFLKLLELLPIPIVASVHGVCLGGGFELALACDFARRAGDWPSPEESSRWTPAQHSHEASSVRRNRRRSPNGVLTNWRGCGSAKIPSAAKARIAWSSACSRVPVASAGVPIGLGPSLNRSAMPKCAASPIS